MNAKLNNHTDIGQNSKVTENPKPETDGRVSYEITGSSRKAVEHLGRIFLDIWLPDHAPEIGAAERQVDGVWRLPASRNEKRDLSLIGQAGFSESLVVHIRFADYEMSRFRYPPIYFEFAEPAIGSLSEPAKPGVPRGYYVEPVCWSGCCSDVGPFATTGEALAWLYREYALEQSTKPVLSKLTASMTREQKLDNLTAALEKVASRSCRGNIQPTPDRLH
jgi:hypothetical protein